MYVGLCTRPVRGRSRVRAVNTGSEHDRVHYGLYTAVYRPCTRSQPCTRRVYTVVYVYTCVRPVYIAVYTAVYRIVYSTGRVQAGM